MKTVLISGCSSGFGEATALEFARAGYRVVATMRDPTSAGGRRLAEQGLSIDLRALDVTDRASIDACVASTIAAYGSIDILVNNAGVHLLGAVEDMAADALQTVMQTNFFGALALTRAVLPGMRARGTGHILTVSSVGSRIGRVADGIYCASKAAIEVALEAMRYEVARFGIHVSVVCPGAFKTGIGRNFVLSDTDAQSPYAALLGYRRDRVREACASGGEPAEVAAVLRQIAEDDRPEFRYLIGAKAIELDRTLATASGRERGELLIGFSGIGWWLSGDNAPEGR